MTLTLAPVPAVKPVVDGEIDDYTGVVAFMGNNRARVICIAMLILYSPLVRVIPRVRPSPTRESFAFMGNEKARI